MKVINTMNRNEFLKRVLSIDQKKNECRENLHKIVLLNATLNQARWSWIEAINGNPQNLEILLRNTVINYQSTSSLFEPTGDSNGSSEILSTRQHRNPLETVNQMEETQIENDSAISTASANAEKDPKQTKVEKDRKQAEVERHSIQSKVEKDPKQAKVERHSIQSKVEKDPKQAKVERHSIQSKVEKDPKQAKVEKHSIQSKVEKYPKQTKVERHSIQSKVENCPKQANKVVEDSKQAKVEKGLRQAKVEKDKKEAGASVISNGEYRDRQYLDNINWRKVMQDLRSSEDYYWTVGVLTEEEEKLKLYSPARYKERKKFLKDIRFYIQRNIENQNSQQNQYRSALGTLNRILLKYEGPRERKRYEYKNRSLKRRNSESGTNDVCKKLLKIDNFFNRLKAFTFSDVRR